MLINLMGKMTYLRGKNTLDLILAYCLLSKVTDILTTFPCTHVYSPDEEEDGKLWMALPLSFERVRGKI